MRSADVSEVLLIAVVFAGFVVVGGWLLVEGIGAVRSRRHEGVTWMALGVLVIAMGGTIVIAL